MWHRIKLKAKIPLAIVGFALVFGAGVGIASQIKAAKSYEELALDRLASIALDRKLQLENYLNSISDDILIVSGSTTASDALIAFRDAFSIVPGNATNVLKKAYIHDNPNPLGSKHLLKIGNSGSSYDRVHAYYHDWFKDVLERKGYYDIFLFDLDGNLVYTVFKEEDFATNFRQGGEWAHTDLGAAFQAAMAGDLDQIHFFDFQPYEPSHGAPASFIATPIERLGERLGVLAFQMPVDRINAIMSVQSGLGKTGETIIFGSDGFMRNDSTFTEQNDILQTKFDETTTEAILNNNGIDPVILKIDGYRNGSLIATGTPLEFLGARWAVGAMQELGEINGPLSAMKLSMLIVGLVMSVLAAAGGYFIALKITRPIDRVVQAMTSLARGDLKVTLGEEDRSDEIGDMFKAVAVFRENAAQRLELERCAQIERDRERHRQSYMEDLVSRFRALVSSTIAQVSGQTDAMRSSADRLASLAKSSFAGAKSAGEASTGASGNMQVVASATEELAASIREIATQTGKSTALVLATSEAAIATDRDVSRLSEAAEHIGTVVSLIRDIAEQTNLLALNATIEAARAGDMGKGFAVVAAEVKTLANQTAKATEEISAQIQSIQSSTRNAVGAMKNISKSVDEIRELSTTIAGAVEEQQAATQEIAQAVLAAASGTDQVAKNVATVTGAVEETALEANSVHDASNSVAKATRDLTEQVENFLNDVATDVEERRGALRVKMKEIVVINKSGRRQSTSMLDMSRSGALIATFGDAAQGDALVIELADGRRIPATVVRRGDNGLGVRFEQELHDLEDLIAA